MAESNQFLRLTLQDTHYLLPSGASLAIEQRDALTVEKSGGPVAAWRIARHDRWPALALDAMLQPARNDRWQRGVFVDAAPNAIGLLADEVQLLTRELSVMPFTPLGAPGTRFGHLFNAAWVEGQNVTLVIDPKVLGAYLRSLGGNA